MWLLRLKNTQWMLIKNVFHPNLPNMCDNPPELWLFGYKECAPPVFTQCAITWMLIVGVDLTHSDPQQNTHRFVRKQALLLNPTLYGGLAIMALPYQLWILTAPTGRFGLVHTSYEFGHIAKNYQNQKKCFKILEVKLSHYCNWKDQIWHWMIGRVQSMNDFGGTVEWWWPLLIFS